MNILFLTIGRIYSIHDKEIYPDLVLTLLCKGHKITVLRISSDPNSVTLSDDVVIVNKQLKGIRGDVSLLKKGVSIPFIPVYMYLQH